MLVGDDVHIVPAVPGSVNRRTGAKSLVHTGMVYDGAACGSMWTSTPTGCIRWYNWGAVGNGKAAVLHPLWGGDGGLRAYALGVAPVATGA